MTDNEEKRARLRKPGTSRDKKVATPAKAACYACGLEIPAEKKGRGLDLYNCQCGAMMAIDWDGEMDRFAEEICAAAELQQQLDGSDQKEANGPQ